MSFAKDIYRDLIDKKLWLVAVLIVVLGGGATMQLGKAGASSVSASTPPPGASGDAGPELSLTRASTTGFARAPHVNKHEIDPFGNSDAQYKKFLKLLKKTLNDVSGSTDASGTGVDTTGTTGGVTPTDNTTGSTGQTPTDNSGTGTGTGTGTTTPASTTPKLVKDDVISVVVTPDDDSQAKELTDVRTLSPLPDADNPFLVYVGKTGDGDAQFIVASNAVASGDGTCSPNVNDCTTVVLSVGQTEKFVVTTTAPTVAGSTTPGETTIQHISITLTDLSTKKVPVDDGSDDATAAAARYQARARAIGARVVQSALIDPKIAKALYKNHVAIGG